MLLELPYEILITEIFSRLDVKSLIRMSMTCKTSYEIILDESLWKPLSIYTLYKPDIMCWKEYVKYFNCHNITTMTNEKYFTFKCNFAEHILDKLIHEEIAPQVNNDHFFIVFLYNYKPLVLIEYGENEDLTRYNIHDVINLANRIVILNYNSIIKSMINKHLYDMLEMYIVQWFPLVLYIMGRFNDSTVSIHMPKKRYRSIKGFTKKELLGILEKLKYDTIPSKGLTKLYIGEKITSILKERDLLLPEVDYSDLKRRCNLQYIYLRGNGFMSHSDLNKYYFSCDSYQQEINSNDYTPYRSYMGNFNIGRNIIQQTGSISGSQIRNIYGGADIGRNIIQQTGSISGSQIRNIYGGTDIGGNIIQQTGSISGSQIRNIYGGTDIGRNIIQQTGSISGSQIRNIYGNTDIRSINESPTPIMSGINNVDNKVYDPHVIKEDKCQALNMCRIYNDKGWYVRDEREDDIFPEKEIIARNNIISLKSKIYSSLKDYAIDYILVPIGYLILFIMGNMPSGT